jgi:hypothetical protein
MRIFLTLLALLTVFHGAVSLETSARLLQTSDSKSVANSTAPPVNLPPTSKATSSDRSNTSSAPKPAPPSSGPASSYPTSTAQSSPQSAPSPAGSSGGSVGKKANSKRDYGAFKAPIASPTTEPKKKPGGSFEAPVASPSSANDPVPVTHAMTASDDDDTNTTSSGSGSTPGNSQPLAHHVYHTDATNSTILLPEQKQPEFWPEFVVALFLVATIVLCALAIRKSCSKRRNYTEVPTTLIV